MWAQIINTILGVWLMFAPTVLQFEGVARDHSYIIGPLLITISYISVWEANRQFRLLNLPVCLWMLISPLAFEFPFPAAVNSIILGYAVAGLSLVEGIKRHSYAGGWAVLWKHDV